MRALKKSYKYTFSNMLNVNNIKSVVKKLLKLEEVYVIALADEQKAQPKVYKTVISNLHGASCVTNVFPLDAGAAAFRSQFAQTSSPQGSKIITGANQAIKRRSEIVKYKKISHFGARAELQLLLIIHF